MPETKNSGTLKKIGGHALQINAFFVSISYNSLPERHDALKSVTAPKRNKDSIMREQPHLLVTHIERLENKPVTIAELVRQTMYLWENGQKRTEENSKLKNPSRGLFLASRRKKLLTHNKKRT